MALHSWSLQAGSGSWCIPSVHAFRQFRYSGIEKVSNGNYFAVVRDMIISPDLTAVI